MRDDFTKAVKEALGKRVSFRCSNPDCRRHTLGPQAQDSGSANIGAAAHITAAAPGGPRFDPDLTPEERMNAANGIWLCRTCATLVDADALGYTVEALREWKALAEATASVELRGFRVVPDEHALFRKVEANLPELTGEMRDDLKQNPDCREFVLLDKRWSYNKSQHENILVYYFNDHRDLRSKIRTLEHYGFVSDISHNEIARFSISEEFAEYLRA